jgi:hypothetical protein
VREVIYFKRPVYVKALTELAEFAFPGGGWPAYPEWWQELTTPTNGSQSAPARVD